ncbi:MAG: fibronectin type III domain-containing protein [Acutalibacteraceae bacterium]
MKRLKKTLSLTLAVVIACANMYAYGFTLSAQEGSWDLIVNGQTVTAAQPIAGVSLSGNTVTLSNFTGKTIETRLCENSQSGSSNTLQINLIGKNKLTGDKITDGAESFFTAIYSQSPEDNQSSIIIGGSGSLDIEISETLPDADIRAIVCGEKFTVSESAEVNISFGGKGIISPIKICGIEAKETEILDSAVLCVKAEASTLTEKGSDGKITFTRSSCPVVGISGRVFNNTKGYLSINAKTASSSSHSLCADGIIQSENSSALYLENKLNTAFSSSLPAIDKTGCREFNLNPQVNYYAVVPVETSPCLKAVDWKALFSSAKYPSFGDDKGIFDKDIFSLNSEAGAYFNRSSYLLTDGVEGEETSDFEKYRDGYFSFHIAAAPMPGFYLRNPSEEDYMYAPEKSASGIIKDTNQGAVSSYYAYAVYDYRELTVTRQPAEYICAINSDGKTREINFSASINCTSHDWKISEKTDGSFLGYGEIGYPYSEAVTANGNSLLINGSDMLSALQSGNNLEGVGLICEVTAMPSNQTAITEPCFCSCGHILPLNFTPTGGENHEKRCLDPDCSYAIASAHTDKNGDGSCDDCGQGGLITVSSESTDITVKTTEKVSFSVKASGDNLRYKWYRVSGGKTLSADTAGFEGMSSPVLTLYPSKTENGNICSFSGDSFFCVITNAYGSYETEKATLSVIHSAKTAVSNDEKTHTGKCFCGADLENSPHTFGEFVQIAAPTCEGYGEKERTCTVCGYRDARVIEPTGHRPDIILAAKAPTCTKKGLTQGKMCSVCSKVIVKQNEIPAKGHTYKNKITKADASGKKNGKITPVCSVCGKTKPSTVIYYPAKATLSYTSKTYTGKALKPSVTVKDSKGKVIKSSNYTVKYTNNKNVGKAVVTVTFKGNYKGSLKASFKINPKATAMSKVTPSSKSFTASWKKQTSQTTGYQLQYSTSSKFTSKTTKTVTVKSAKALTYKVTKLKANTKYYVRVRTYKTVGKTNYYSSWSKALTVRTK